MSEGGCANPLTLLPTVVLPVCTAVTDQRLPGQNAGIFPFLLEESQHDAQLQGKKRDPALTGESVRNLLVDPLRNTDLERYVSIPCWASEGFSIRNSCTVDPSVIQKRV